MTTVADMCRHPDHHHPYLLDTLPAGTRRLQDRLHPATAQLDREVTRLLPALRRASTHLRQVLRPASTAHRVHTLAAMLLLVRFRAHIPRIENLTFSEWA